MIVNGANLVKVRHPSYSAQSESWRKWRTTYRGGEDFNEAYIEKYSNLEDPSEFRARKKISPTPSFAKSAVNKVKNSIFQRMADIIRRGGTETYQQSIQGQGFGVDLHGTAMNTFMGREIVPELLTMAKVGIFVDMPPVNGTNLLAAQGKVPYLYAYKAEEILSWSYRRDKIEEFQSVLLVDYIDQLEEFTGLPSGQWKRHRYCWIDENGKVWVMLFDEEGNQIDMEGRPSQDPIPLDLPYIPFITLELTDSLLSDVANHQVALANAESADMAYILKSNFPLYVEQVDEREFSGYLKGPAGAENEGTAAEAAMPEDRHTVIGNSVGRRYRKGLNEPSFINPSPEPVMVSMKKQDQLKDDILTLINLSLSQIKPKMASAESKALDERGLESGLAYIGLELERGERRIAKIWSDYEKSNDVAIVTYPEKWALVSDEDRRKNAQQLEELRDTVPSPTFQKLMNEQIVLELVGNKINSETLATISKELLSADSVTANPDTIFMAVDKGILSLELAAILLGFPKDQPDKASQDHADKLARILKSQTKAPGARGVKEMAGDPKGEAADEKAESRDNTQQASTEDRTRGDGK